MPGNEAGMCLGINGFTNYAPIADWGRKRLGGRIHGGVCPVCVPGLLVSRLAHFAKSAMHAPPARPEHNQILKELLTHESSDLGGGNGLTLAPSDARDEQAPVACV